MEQQNEKLNLDIENGSASLVAEQKELESLVIERYVKINLYFYSSLFCFKKLFNDNKLTIDCFGSSSSTRILSKQGRFDKKNKTSKYIMNTKFT